MQEEKDNILNDADKAFRQNLYNLTEKYVESINILSESYYQHLINIAENLTPINQDISTILMKNSLDIMACDVQLKRLFRRLQKIGLIQKVT